MSDTHREIKWSRSEINSDYSGRGGGGGGGVVEVKLEPKQIHSGMTLEKA